MEDRTNGETLQRPAYWRGVPQMVSLLGPALEPATGLSRYDDSADRDELAAKSGHHHHMAHSSRPTPSFGHLFDMPTSEEGSASIDGFSDHRRASERRIGRF